MACQSPLWVLPGGAFREVPVPCGRCPPCAKRRIDSWVFRLKQHEKVCTSSHFVTLTYSPDFLPISPNGWMTLDKGEFPRYMKRLRKLCPGAKLSYYACGEYGTIGKRPHYHAIIFNVPNDTIFFDAWHLDGVAIGKVHVGTVTGDSIAYCCKYMNSSEFFSFHAGDDRIPEFSLMSKGMGLNYVSDAIKRYHNDDLSRNYLTVDGGHKIALPRYYKSRLYASDTDEDRRMLADESSRKRDVDNRDYHARLYGSNPEYTYEQFVIDQRTARNVSFKKSKKVRDV